MRRTTATRSIPAWDTASCARVTSPRWRTAPGERWSGSSERVWNASGTAAALPLFPAHVLPRALEDRVRSGLHIRDGRRDRELGLGPPPRALLPPGKRAARHPEPHRPR